MLKDCLLRVEEFSVFQHVTIESFTPCLVDLCKALWEVMRSYYQTIQWHENHDQMDETEEGKGTFLLLFLCN